MNRLRSLILSVILAVTVRGADVAPAPTKADVAYGPYERNVLDFWQAPSATAAHPAPLVIFIHGGGFSKGDKTQVRTKALVQQCLDAGVSFAAINYRFRATASLPEILRDCARSLQFIRTQAGAWNIDPARIAAFGSSAGAGTSLWLGFHDDLADPTSSDPVLRESTRLVCAGALSTQFSYDFLRWHELFSDELIARYGKAFTAPSFYGLKTEEELRGPVGVKIRADCDMLGLMGKSAAPFFLSASLPDLALDSSGQFLHHPTHAQRLYDRARELGVPVVAAIPALGIAPPKDSPHTLRDFLFKYLHVASVATAKPDYSDL